MFLLLIISFPAMTFAAEKTVKECAAEIRRSSSLNVSEKEANDICKQHSQKTVDCAIQLKRAKSMSMTLQDALAECSRPRD
jgi:plasmid maintenance system antidote protein VapI